MDVGLNNRNTLGEIAPELTDVVFLVEATSAEQHNLWSEWSEQSMTNVEPLDNTDVVRLKMILKPLHTSLMIQVEALNDKVKRYQHTRVKWEQISAGFTITIGHVVHKGERLPVAVSFSFAIINGKKVCFYYCCSRATDSEMVEKFLISRFQLTHDGYSRWNHVDAGNFHNCVNSLDDLDEEPRDTVYKGDHYEEPKAFVFFWAGQDFSELTGLKHNQEIPHDEVHRISKEIFEQGLNTMISHQEDGSEDGSVVLFVDNKRFTQR